MTKPNFEAMTRKDLLAYMLEHREDNEAFYAYMDKVNAEPTSEFYPAPQSIDDLKHFPQLLQKFRQEREKEV
jgi:aromatic ring hydroxylase